MGNAMSDPGWSLNWWAKLRKNLFEKTYPFYDGNQTTGIPIGYDQMEGFPEGRKERELPNATKQHLDSMNMDMFDRNFCSDEAIIFKRCQYQNWPMVNWCSRELHHYEHCLQDDFRLRMREFERERRLNARAARIEEKEAIAAARARMEAMAEEE